VEPGEPTVVVGAITKAHGLRGEVAVEVRSDNPDRFVPGAAVFLPDGSRLRVERSHPHGARLLVKFEQVSGRSQADELRGQVLSVPESWLPELPDGEFWPFQLEGCEVVTGSGRSLGRVTEVIPNPANDLWVAVDDEGTETMVPAIRDVVVRVDLARQRIEVRDVPGLTAPEGPGAR
jgi:16S rRNA processing protein RimM